MKRKITLTFAAAVCFSAISAAQELTDYVNPFLGTATLWEKEVLGYERHRKSRTWGG